MAISDELFAITLAIIFIYLLVYKKNKIVGDIFFFLTGLTLIAYGWVSGTGANQELSIAGILITVASIGSFIYDMLPDKKIRRHR